MAYRLEIERKARHAMRRFPERFRERMIAAMQGLTEDPLTHGYIKLKGRVNEYRIEVGHDYRLRYSFDTAAQVLTILQVGHRSDFYDD
jgi:mRNA-degrading endonuclease RelE of RelBE toxin-antitoxin system